MKRLLVFLALVCGVGMCYAAKKPLVSDEYVLHYPSIDQYGDSLVLSGNLSVPAGKQPKGIILVPHYTIASNMDAPSVKMTADGRTFAEDYVVLVPDYLGYGLTADRVHPYLHGELTAHNCVDMLLYAQPKLDSMQLGIPLDSIYIVGFSQGGASAMWTLKLLEEQYADRIHVIKCFAGAGPYDVAVTYDEAMITNRSMMPMVIPLLFEGTNAAYDLQLDRANFFTPALEKVYSKYIEKKDHDIVTIFFKTLNHKVSHWISKPGRDMTRPETQRMYDGFVRSSLVHDTICPSWTPRSPLYIYHSKKDDVVTFRCAERLQQCYKNLPNITYDFGNYGGHLQSSRRFFPKVKEMLDNQR